ncbi:hypothetical protein [uncultured Fluviicola sp.]|uniref:hypothetical protein n=1 Tax=uncultured Fluviicola sp. TaxID=463303 RepID=UPI0025EB7D2E|nr:hypothetical protein [uncultured Fluviicola sp.]
MNKLLIFLLPFIALYSQSQTMDQDPKRVTLKKVVPGMCVPSKQVLELYGGNPDEVEPKCMIDKEELTERLNSDLSFLKNHPEFKGRGMISIVINCEGKVIGWSEVVKSKNRELNDEILAYLMKQDFEWEAGKYKEEKIDSIYSFSYQIVRGKLRLN